MWREGLGMTQKQEREEEGMRGETAIGIAFFFNVFGSVVSSGS